jgi:hypothetical protein
MVSCAWLLHAVDSNGAATELDARRQRFATSCVSRKHDEVRGYQLPSKQAGRPTLPKVEILVQHTHRVCCSQLQVYQSANLHITINY